MGNSLKVGILGCGAVAKKWYLPGLSNKNAFYKIDAVADLNIKRAKNSAKRFNIPNYYKSLKGLMKHKPKLDLIVVLTRHQDHYIHIKSALKNGFHVYSEKPFAENPKKGIELIKLARSKKLYFGAAPQSFLATRFQKLKDLIEKGRIGKITLARISGSNMGPAYRKGVDYDPRWFYNEGGSLDSLGIYNLTATIFLFGMPKRVSGFSGIVMPKRVVMYGPMKGEYFKVTAPDNEVAILDFGEGIFALFDGSYSVYNPPKFDFEIHGTNGSLFSGGFGGKESIILIKNGQEHFVGPEDDCHFKWTLAWGVEETIKAIIQKKKNKLDAKIALDTIIIIDAIRKSSLTNKQILIKT
ncbi:Gfo/Idh/MocA family oxidoreductase [Candidatus Woesearchaeota archaeon]|nr:Gfo/Idh/MocA family oxidoreductase [Candidatus Woesearchaeota archaeon]